MLFRSHAGQRISFLIVGYDSRPTSEAVDNVEEQLAIEIGDQCREILTNNWPGVVVVLVKTDPPSTADPSRALSLSTFWSGNAGQRSPTDRVTVPFWDVTLCRYSRDPGHVCLFSGCGRAV